MPLTERQQRTCEFWLGRAGSGKTYGCLADMAKELIRSPRGCPLILIAPEQATAQLERRLATWPGVPAGFTRARVLSFNHLMREAFTRAGGQPRRLLGESGRIMLLRQLLRHPPGELSVFTGSSGQTGLAETLMQTLVEFQRYGWTVADLERWLADQPPEKKQKSLLVRKMSDLALLWGAYEEVLSRGKWMDTSGLVEAAAHSIRNWGDLDGAHVWIDGFASLTAQEMALFEALISHTQRLTIALCLDPTTFELPAPMPGSNRIGAQRLFENMETACRTLAERLDHQGWDVTLCRLPKQGAPTRFSPTPQLAHLEQHVLGCLHPQPYTGPADADAIELIEATDRRAEIEAVARRIVTLCRRYEEAGAQATPEQPTAMTWRDVAVLGRDLDPYAPLIREVFTQFEIPFFIDQPRQTEGHPVARLLLTALAVLRSGWAGDTVIQHLKSGLAGLHDEYPIAQIENHIRAIDRQRRGWLEPLRQDPKLAKHWQPAEDSLRRLETALRSRQSPARGLWQLIEDVQTARTLETWIAEARETGDEETVQIHEQAWEQTLAWLEELDALYGTAPDLFGSASDDWPTRLDNLGAMIESALSIAQARLIPPTLNQVTVGAVDRSRMPDAQIAFVIGMNEKEFPRLWNPDPILGDEERAGLTSETGRKLGPDSRQKRIQEHYLAYIALTRACKRLVVTRPLIDAEGKPSDPSNYFVTIADTFPEAPRRLVRRAASEDAPQLPLRPEEWMLQLNEVISRREEMAETTPETVAHIRRLLGRGHPLAQPQLSAAQRQALATAIAAMATRAEAALTPDLALAFWQKRAQLHVTALEGYGACPFKFFSTNMLGLKERDEASLSIMDLGTIRHELLHAVFSEYKGPDGLDWHSLDADKVDEFIDTHFSKLPSDERYIDRLKASAVNGLVLGNCGDDLKLLVRALGLVAERSRFRQTGSEWSFGKDAEFKLSGGPLEFALRGTVDRVDRSDETAVIFDYKSGQRKLDLTRLIYGIDLQLPLYALALTETAKQLGHAIQVKGLFYWPLGAPLHSALPGDGSNSQAVDEAWFKKRAPSGIFDEAIADWLDERVGPKEKSLAFGFNRVSSGKLGTRQKTNWPTGAIDQLIAYERGVVEGLLGKIASGQIGASPWQIGGARPCDYCPFGGLCGLAEGDGISQRDLPTLTREDALKIIESGNEVSVQP